MVVRKRLGGESVTVDPEGQQELVDIDTPLGQAADDCLMKKSALT